jgi:hypothetical protein
MSTFEARSKKSRQAVALFIALTAALVEGSICAAAYRNLPVGPACFFSATTSGYAALMALAAGSLTWLLKLIIRRPRPAAALGAALAWFALFSWRGLGIAAVLDTGPTITKDVAAPPVWPVYSIAGGPALVIGLIAWLLAGRTKQWIPQPLALSLALLVLAGGLFVTRSKDGET